MLTALGAAGVATMIDDRLALLLVGRYGLTYREARLALLFAGGYSLGRAADELGVSKGTAQGYIKAVHRKTGVHRKDDLVDILARAEG